MSALGSSRTSSATSSERTAFDAVPPPDGARSASRRAPLRLSLKVRLSRGRLDRQLLAGRGADSEALALRAGQLTAPRSQQKLARALRGVLAYAERRQTPALITSVVIEPRAVRHGRHAIVDLAERLERAGSVEPGGIVLARALLSDGLSPLFNPRSERTVTEAVHEVLDRLGEDPAVAALAA